MTARRAILALAAVAVTATTTPPSTAASPRLVSWSYDVAMTFTDFGTGVDHAVLQGVATQVRADGTLLTTGLSADLDYHAAPGLCPAFWTAIGPFTAGDLSGSLAMQGAYGALTDTDVSVSQPNSQWGEGFGTYVFTGPAANPCGQQTATARLTGVVLFPT